METLFPSQPKRETGLTTPGSLEAPPFTEVELLKAASSMRNKKAPGPDGLPAEVLKAVAQSHPKLLLDMYNMCLSAGVFPATWKRARLVLISKGKGPADAASSYRPLCMLDTAGKLLEKLLRPRLHEAVRAAGDLCLLATLDVRNAFDSVRWDLAMEAFDLQGPGVGTVVLYCTVVG